MNDPMEITWLLGEISIVVLALWLVVRILFRRAPGGPKTRGAHISKGIIYVSVALAWAMLYLVTSFNLSFAGGHAKLIRALDGVGAAVFVVLLWGAVKNFWLAFRHAPPPRPASAERKGTKEVV
jgi:hypothetical protein